ncbi:hypothetical protein H310_02428 [Aphanomyces invadans]|uniref:FAM86 N-terminal domain-containing protein n=1 Tax=Aphanomyces invadans TaxID=157072 RepID=A0A024UNN6_9STRA|nr:hypothetical protein H310_02428 [Aphanomyces invadans]ETW08061.1 hypothetical protein H310_02428 [Aphanomyces invadans]|eukprot:XP_008864154.1 hypothetical protein H310_02428 [Aphanomyces invadans]
MADAEADIWGRLSLPSFRYTISEPKHGIPYITAIQDRSACLAEKPIAASHGHLVWDAALVLADYMQQVHAKATTLESCRAIELGAGIGLVGMVLAALGCMEVTLTDQPYCIPLLAKNVEANFGDTVSVVRPRVKALQWGQLVDDEMERKMDLIVASDVLYNASVFPDLIHTLDALANPTTQIFLCYEPRIPTQEASFFAQLEAAGFTLQSITFSSTQVDYPDDMVLVRAVKHA